LGKSYLSHGWVRCVRGELGECPAERTVSVDPKNLIRVMPA
jgi:hypothetical protein